MLKFNNEEPMKKAKSFFFFFLFVSILSLSYGCATLPNVSEMMDEAPTSQAQPQIASVKGRDLAESDQIRWEEWEKRPLLLKIREWFSQLFARWSDTNVENGFA